MVILSNIYSYISKYIVPRTLTFFLVCSLKLFPLTTSVFLKGYLRPIFSLIVLNVSGFFMVNILYAKILKKFNMHVTIIK